ncbi:MAG: hypothetical protein JSU72_08625 [Deltaproteobacteria bacterium]|nr:MAG: hypothetical protein JSU72_08625 [Deltaproteobacteria bacterium]
MGEIKSTLDLVLEKTKHLTLSAEEKAEVRLQEALKKVPGYVERVINRVFTPERLLDEIQSFPQALQPRIRREIARQMCHTLDLSEKTDPLAEALEVLAEPGWATLLAEVRQSTSEYRQARVSVRQEAENRILTRLAETGVRGSAVVAKLEDDPSWKAEDGRLRHHCEQKLVALREALNQQAASS